MSSSASTAFLPVIPGGDFGIYGVDRSFNEAFGCRYLCVSNSPTVAITRSDFSDVHHIPSGISDADLLATLLTITQANEGQELVLMANHSLYSSSIARNFDALAHVYASPFPFQEIIDQLTDKAGFARACAQPGIDMPRSTEASFAHCNES